MRLEYDPQIDAAYIYLRPAGASSEVAKTVPLDPREIDREINLDFDRDGHLIGIEIQTASRFLDASLLLGVSAHELRDQSDRADASTGALRWVGFGRGDTAAGAGRTRELGVVRPW